MSDQSNGIFADQNTVRGLHKLSTEEALNGLRKVVANMLDREKERDDQK